MISLSAIDQERFGIVTARDPMMTTESLGPALEYCRVNGVRLLIARCSTEDLRVAQRLEEAGARLMDTLVYFTRHLNVAEPGQLGAVPVRRLREGEADEIRNVAAEAFRDYFGHYHADGRLARAACDEVYASWAHRSCLDERVASRVLVAEHEGRVAGFLTLATRGPEEQEIVLNAVDPRAQRHGIYRSLLLAAIEQARNDHAKRLIISTQLTNVAVQRTWTRLAFEPARSYYTFHLWLGGE